MHRSWLLSPVILLAASAVLAASAASASDRGIVVEPIRHSTTAGADLDGPISFLWSYCGGGHSELVVSSLNQPYQLLSPLSGFLPGNPTVAWAPDGLAFAAEFPGGGIAVFDIVTGAVSRITDGEDLSPSWSNDGSAIAFARVDQTSGTSDLWRVGPDGSDLEQVTNTPKTLEFGPAWSPDDSQVAYVASESPDSGFDVWVMNSDRTGTTNLTSDPIYFYDDLAWSPDASKLAATAFTSSYPDIVIVSLSGAPIRNLTEDDSFLSASDPAWSPDGLQIAHSRQAGDGDTDIWVMDSDGGNSVQWTDLAECAGNPAWKPWPGEGPATSEWITFFSDAPPVSLAHRVEAHGFAHDIAWLASTGITKGCNPPRNSRFCPDTFVTRGQMAAFLVRSLGLTERFDNPFIDDDDSVFEADIEKLAAAGITKGCNPPVNDRFCPDGTVTREQMAAFLVRALEYTDDGGGDLFVDDDDSIFEADIDRLGTAGVTRGCNPPTNDRFCPKGNVTRGQMAAFLHRALG